LGISDPSDELNDDEIDAIVCVLAGICSIDSMTETDLIEQWVSRKKGPPNAGTIKTERPSFFTPPAGYRVLPSSSDRSAPRLSVEKKKWSDYKIP
jgi:hypothetical protein